MQAEKIVVEPVKKARDPSPTSGHKSGSQPAKKARAVSTSDPPPTGLRGFRGVLIHSKALGELEILRDGLLVYDTTTGVITNVTDLTALSADQISDLISVRPDGSNASQVPDEVEALGQRFLMPGLIDGHAHAPQYAFTGTGMDLPLLEWLETYTFPCEAKFSDLEHARHVYSKAVHRHIKNGTTTCAWFASLHLEATKLLVDIVREKGQRAHIGKVSMDRNSPSYYIEETVQGIADVESLIDYVKETGPDMNSNTCIPCSTKGAVAPSPPPPPTASSNVPASTAAATIDVDDLVTATIIPRFVPSCTSAMMHALGRLSSLHNLPVHSHLSESPGEIEWVKQLHPDCASYGDVYYQHGLMHERTYMAHCVHCSKGERSLMRDTGCGVVHCPSSNFMLKSGVCDVRRLLVEGVKVGLGTDIAGGCSSSMFDSIRQCVIASRTASFGQSPDDEEVVEAAVDASATITVAAGAVGDIIPSDGAAEEGGNVGGANVGGDPTEPLNYAEAFHLATMGGASVLGLDDKIGNFLPGKSLDALIIDPHADDSNFDLFGLETVDEIFEKFLFLGDDRNVCQVFVQGRNVYSQDTRSRSRSNSSASELEYAVPPKRSSSGALLKGTPVVGMDE